MFRFFFFNDTATTEIYTLSLHDALPIYRATYTGLGTKHKSYSLAEAVSTDGLTWNRGASEDNVSLAPRPGTWERKMIGYPHVLTEGDSLRIFYNGTGGGRTGIGMAVAKLLD